MVNLLHSTVTCKFAIQSLDPQDTEFGKGYTFSGHGAAWAQDLAGNVLVKGAFLPSIAERVPQRMVKIRWMHFDPMGFVTAAKEDDIGLYIDAFVPATPMNAERMALMASGVVDKLSIGFDPDFSAITYSETARRIPKLTLYEVSAVDLPLNEATDIDTVTKLGLAANGRKIFVFGHTLTHRTKRVQMINAPLDMPFADLFTEWDGTGAIQRLQDFYKATDAPNADYDACFIYVKDGTTTLDDHALPIVDIIGTQDDSGAVGEPAIIPNAVIDAAAAIEAGDHEIPDAEVQAAKDVIDAYFVRMQEAFGDPSLVSPWDTSSNDEYSGKKLTQFIGATLNSTNMQLLKDAHTAIGTVLASAKKEADDTTDKKDKKKEDKTKEDQGKDAEIILTAEQMLGFQLVTMGHDLGLRNE